MQRSYLTHLTSSHLIASHLISSELTGRRCCDPGRSASHDSVCRGCDQLQHSRFGWNEVGWGEVRWWRRQALRI